MSHEPASILITGAAGAVGSALALEYARPGVTLHLGDRNEAALQSVAQRCRERNATVWLDAADVRDAHRMAEWVHLAESRCPLDLILIVAGVSHGDLDRDETAEEVRAVFDVNLDGMLNVLLPALPLLRSRRSGQLALMSSLAGARGLPHAPSYSATKAATRVFGEALRLRLKRENVRVSVIDPGFIDSPLTRYNRFRMPFLMSPEGAARTIRKDLARDRGHIVFPWPMAVSAWILSLIPSRIFEFFAAPRSRGPTTDGSTSTSSHTQLD